nr:unnamed protein product [uncultured bacterium]
MLRDFDKWLDTFIPSINQYDYYVDFEKVYTMANEFKIELNILNSLVGSKNIEHEFEELLKKYPNVINAIPILIAKRESEIYCQDFNGSKNFKFKYENNQLTDDFINECKYFMKKTGLFELIENHIISNLMDYITGVEVGLDSNARKNRGGKQMAKLVEDYIKATGCEYYVEMTTGEIEKRWGINLSRITNGSRSTKRFDFVVKTNNQIYGIETNFYTGSGSKLNEVSRSYKELAQETLFINGFSFVWITDGSEGWTKTKRNLRETFDILEHIYNINDLKQGILKDIFK